MPIMDHDQRETVAAIRLLGGADALGGAVLTNIEIHDLIEAGMPPEALGALIEALPEILKDADLVPKLLGVSVGRAWFLARSKERLNSVLSDRIWRFAVTAGLLVSLYGETEAAQRTLLAPLSTLHGRRPIDLMTTAPGSRLVWEHFKRAEFGVSV